MRAVRLTWAATDSRRPRRAAWLAVLVLVLHVLAEGAGVAETLAAVLAAERLLAAMQPVVLGEVVLVLKRLVTDGAHERSLTCQHTILV